LLLQYYFYCTTTTNTSTSTTTTSTSTTTARTTTFTTTITANISSIMIDDNRWWYVATAVAVWIDVLRSYGVLTRRIATCKNIMIYHQYQDLHLLHSNQYHDDHNDNDYSLWHSACSILLNTALLATIYNILSS
jgi:uncharacterized ion transporter superfamily protein YfcC